MNDILVLLVTLKDGTGKSTLIQFIIAALGLNLDEDVCYIAYTGKAAQVLRNKGCPNAITAHKLLYYAKLMPNGTYQFTKKRKLDEDYKIIVVDEISMLPKEMWDLLLTHKIHVLACGDPFQIPPIDPTEDNHVLDKPHVFLDEIMRQAYDSEIIRLSMWIREGKPLNTFQAKGEQVQIQRPAEVVSGMYLWADQILCATNKTRNSINNQVRQLKGFPNIPTKGDKIISLRNQWGCLSSSSDPQPLTNGSIGIVENFYVDQLYIPPWITKEPVHVMYTTMNSDDEVFDVIPVDYNTLLKNEKSLTGEQEFRLKRMKNMDITPPFEFAYGYAITTHKAQGSSWPKVLAFEEKFPIDKVEHARHLYTSITRAEDKLVVVSSARN